MLWVALLKVQAQNIVSFLNFGFFVEHNALHVDDYKWQYTVYAAIMYLPETYKSVGNLEA